MYLVVLLLNDIFDVEFLILQRNDPSVVFAQHTLDSLCVFIEKQICVFSDDFFFSCDADGEFIFKCGLRYGEIRVRRGDLFSSNVPNGQKINYPRLRHR